MLVSYRLRCRLYIPAIAFCPLLLCQKIFQHKATSGKEMAVLCITIFESQNINILSISVHEVCICIYIIKLSAGNGF